MPVLGYPVGRRLLKVSFDPQLTSVLCKQVELGYFCSKGLIIYVWTKSAIEVVIGNDLTRALMPMSRQLYINRGLELLTPEGF